MRALTCRHGRQVSICAICAPEADADYVLRKTEREDAERRYRALKVQPQDVTKSLRIDAMNERWPEDPRAPTGAA